MHRAFPGLGSLGKLAQIGDLGQVKAGQIVDQVCDVGGCGRRGTWQEAPIRGKSTISCQKPLYY